MILEVPLDLARGDVESNHGRGVEIVPGTLIAEPGTAVAGAPEREVGLGIVGARHPDGSATALVVLAAGRPSLTAGLVRSRNRICFPELLAGLRIESGEEPAHPQFAP